MMRVLLQPGCLNADHVSLDPEEDSLARLRRRSFPIRQTSGWERSGNKFPWNCLQGRRIYRPERNEMRRQTLTTLEARIFYSVV